MKPVLRRSLINRTLFLGATLAALHIGNSCSSNFKFAADVGQYKAQSCLMDESTMSAWHLRDSRVGYVGNQKVSYVPHSDGWMLVDGDKIVRTKGDLPEQPLPEHLAQSVGVGVGNTWPNGVIPYTISPNLPNPQRVLDAIAHWNNLLDPVIKFVPRSDPVFQPDYVYFVPVSGGCAATVGFYRGAGPHTVELAPECGSGNVAHELGHVVGLDHEQNRKDRDNHVQIVAGKILAGFETNFAIEQSYQDYGPYNFGSIMHYTLYAFSSDGSQTIIPRVTLSPNIFVGQRRGLSIQDINGVRLMYGYPEIANYTPPNNLNSSEGLFGRYYNNPNFSGVPTAKVDNNILFNWGLNQPAAGVPADRFSVRWTGFLVPTVSGDYTFHIDTTDQINFTLQGTELLNFNGGGQYLEVRSTRQTLIAGQRYQVKLDLVAADGPKRLRLRWTRPDGGFDTIPKEVLQPETSEAPASCLNSVTSY